MKILRLTPSVIEEKRRDPERNMTKKKNDDNQILNLRKKRLQLKSRLTNEIFKTHASDLHSLPCVANSSFSAVRLTHPAGFPALESSDSLLLATILNCDLCSLALNTDLCSPALTTGSVGSFLRVKSYNRMNIRWILFKKMKPDWRPWVYQYG